MQFARTSLHRHDYRIRQGHYCYSPTRPKIKRVKINHSRSQIAAMASIIIQTVDPENATHIEEFRMMTRKYLEWLDVDLGFQGIEDELALLPGSYHPQSSGCMILAYETTAENTNCVGAVALRPLLGQHLENLKNVGGLPVTEICEMKRLFVLPSHQCRGAGTALTIAIADEARALGYKAMVLDTLDRLTGANTLYKAQGFELCERYNDCPLSGVLYFSKRL